MPEESFRKYAVTYLKFVKHAKLQPGATPTTEQFKAFFLDLLEEGHYSTSTIHSMYSHVQKAALTLHGIDLNMTKSIYDPIRFSGKDAKVKKAKAFEANDLNR